MTCCEWTLFFSPPALPNYKVWHFGQPEEVRTSPSDKYCTHHPTSTFIWPFYFSSSLCISSGLLANPKHLVLTRLLDQHGWHIIGKNTANMSATPTRALIHPCSLPIPYTFFFFFMSNPVHHTPAGRPVTELTGAGGGGGGGWIAAHDR